MSTVPLPAMADEEVSAANIFDSTHQSPSLQQASFFRHAITLAQILSGILNQIYEPWRQLEAKKLDDMEEAKQNLCAKSISCYIQLDQDLDQFEAGLPEPLCSTSTAFQLYDTAVLRQQRHVLRAR
jgi:hypothetical protein